MSNIVKVPVLPYTHRMMMKLFGSKGLISFDKDSLIGTMMQVGLEKIDYNLKPRTMPVGSVELKFKLPKCFQDLDLTEKTAINVGRFLNEFFKHSMAMYVAGMSNLIRNKQAASTAFLEWVGATDYIELDTAKKMAKRRVVSYNNHRRTNLRKDNAINNFTQKSPQNPQTSA